MRSWCGNEDRYRPQGRLSAESQARSTRDAHARGARDYRGLDRRDGQQARRGQAWMAQDAHQGDLDQAALPQGARPYDEKIARRSRGAIIQERVANYNDLPLQRDWRWLLPSPARHGGCKKRLQPPRRLPSPWTGRGILEVRTGKLGNRIYRQTG